MTRKESWWVSTPVYTGRVEVADGKVAGGMVVLRWSWGKRWEWLTRYLDARWPGKVYYKLMAREVEA